jgi:hypothetical protein
VNTTVRSLSRRIEPVSAAALSATVGVALAVAATIAVVLPYRQYDAFAFGSWSRQIAAGEGIHAPGVVAVQLQRPLFYVLQGWIWELFGFHEQLGRVLSFVFTLVLVAGVAVLARARGLALLAPALAVALTFLVPDVQAQIAGGITDLPVAACVAAAGAFAWRGGGRWWSYVGAASASACACLTKSTGLVAIAALAAATLIGTRAELRARGAAAGAVAVGALVGVVYDLHEASVVGLSFFDFMRAGTEGMYEQLAAQMRGDVLLRIDWLGADVRLLLCFAAGYALARGLRSAHRPAVGFGLVLAVLGSWVSPALASGGSAPGPFASGFGWHPAAYVVLLATLACAIALPHESAPDRHRLIRLLVWSLPPFAVWVWHGVYANRLLSPAWPALIVLTTECLGMALLGARRLRSGLVAVPVAMIIALLVLALPNFDSLTRPGWDAFWSAAPSGWTNRARMQQIALGGFADEVGVVRREVRTGETVVSNDGRLRFFAGPGFSYPQGVSCDALRGHRLFVLQLSPESRAALEAEGAGASDPSRWAACEAPRVHLIEERPDEYAAFVIGGEPRTAGLGCPSGERATGIVAVFRSGIPAREAQELRDSLVARGFSGTTVERDGCSSYSVVLGSIPSDAVAQDFAAEAAKAGTPVQIEHR